MLYVVNLSNHLVIVFIKCVVGSFMQFSNIKHQSCIFPFCPQILQVCNCYHPRDGQWWAGGGAAGAEGTGAGRASWPWPWLFMPWFRLFIGIPARPSILLCLSWRLVQHFFIHRNIIKRAMKAIRYCRITSIDRLFMFSELRFIKPTFTLLFSAGVWLWLPLFLHISRFTD